MSTARAITDLLVAVATELDVEIFAPGQHPTTRRVLDPEEREGLVVELADALGVGHAGVEAYSIGTLSIDPTAPVPEAEVLGVEVPEILLDRGAVAGVFRACAIAARAMADRFDVHAERLDPVAGDERPADPEGKGS